MKIFPMAVMRLLLVLVCGATFVQAQESEDETRLGWTNETELSLVLTGGNSTARTFGFGNTSRHVWDAARLQVRLNGIRTETSGERFLLTNPGVKFPVGGFPETENTTLIRPTSESDVENYQVSGRYDRDISERLFWNAGGSWDRNTDAGLLNRYVGFGGLGNIWSDTETVHFYTTYAVSYTDREEVTRNPEKAARFGGVRLGWDYLNRFRGGTVYENDFTTNINMTNTSDYSLNMMNALGVSMSNYLSLRISLQLLFENEPALEDIDIIARAELIDPDGTPSSGDEFFETVTSGGSKSMIGKGRIRKDRLDSIFRTALLISF